jgi:hypothetical protein
MAQFTTYVTSSFAAFATALVLGAMSPSASAAEFWTKQVRDVHAGDGRPCVFFTLQNPGQTDPIAADPVIAAGSAWFALPKSHVTFKENYSLLLTSKLTKAPIHVITTGALISECGHVGVSFMVLP